MDARSILRSHGQTGSSAPWSWCYCRFWAEPPFALVTSWWMRLPAKSPNAWPRAPSRIERRSPGLGWGTICRTWTTPCPIKVRLTEGEAGGLTSFGFTRGRVTDQRMTVEGRLDRILASALPHEVTHTIFASYFGGPMPRWADEGASLLSEDQRERTRHDQIVDDLLAARGEVPLSRLFAIEEYPKDLMSFYGQGYSISRFLIEMGGRPRFLKFVKDGLENNWDTSTRAHYNLPNVRELDRAWRSWHRVALHASRESTVDEVFAFRNTSAEPVAK